MGAMIQEGLGTFFVELLIEQTKKVSARIGLKIPLTLMLHLNHSINHDK